MYRHDNKLETKFMNRQNHFRKLIFLAGAVLLCVALAMAQNGKQTLPKNEKRFGFLHSFKQTKGAWQIRVDYAEMFEGDEAIKAAKADKADYSPDDSSGIYIRNKNPKIHAVAVNESAEVYLLSEMQPTKVALKDFARLMRGETKNLPEFYAFPPYGTNADYLPVEVTLENGVVTKIEQVYFP